MKYQIGIVWVLVILLEGISYSMGREIPRLKEIVLIKTAQGYADRFLKEQDPQALYKEINEKVPIDLVDDLKSAIRDELCRRFFFLFLNKTQPFILTGHEGPY